MPDTDLESRGGSTGQHGRNREKGRDTPLSWIVFGVHALLRSGVEFSARSNLFGLPHVLTAGFCLWIAWIVSPPLLGFWEGSVYFHTFSPEEIWLNTAIHPRSCIGCYEYASMDLSRYLSYVFGLSLHTLRAVPILAGLLSLWLSYRTRAKRVKTQTKYVAQVPT